MFLAWGKNCTADFSALRELLTREDLSVGELLEREEVVSAAQAGEGQVIAL